ncbi:MAG TPA: NAD(P)H-quinone oxidoreductase [Gemmatimonadaceae bacterium]
MKAVVITKPGGPEVLEVQERPLPEPGLNQVRVRIRASALNRADISQRLGRYPAPPGSPQDIPGLEYSGEIDAVGQSSSMWPIGAKVMGITGGGAHAEYLCVHEREVMPAPSTVALTDAAAIPEAFITAYDALFERLQLGAGETVLIHAAASGVGTAAIQLARLAGVRTVGTSRSRSKLDRCLELGLDAAFHITDTDWAERLQSELDTVGVNAVLDLVGAAYLNQNLNVLAHRGRLVSVGLTAGSKAELDMGLVMRKRLSIIGTVLRARALEEKIQVAREFAERIVPQFEAGRLKPIIDRQFPFDRIAQAHRVMESNETFGKLVLVWS